MYPTIVPLNPVGRCAGSTAASIIFETLTARSATAGGLYFAGGYCALAIAQKTAIRRSFRIPLASDLNIGYNFPMPTFRVDTPQCSYPVIVERGAVAQTASHIPKKAGKVFVVSNQDVLRLHGEALQRGLEGRAHELVCIPPGESKK